ncbi:MAG: hypothetical protein AAGA96_10460 [Verrucomicrobiota bacterium]
MAIAALLILLIGLAAAFFGFWGQHTESGRHRYDEMDGMIPLFAWWAGVSLIVVAIVLGNHDHAEAVESDLRDPRRIRRCDEFKAVAWLFSLFENREASGIEPKKRLCYRFEIVRNEVAVSHGVLAIP